MRSAGAASAWEFGRRHRWGWIALAIYFTLLAIIKFLVLDPGYAISLDSSWSFALVVVVPMGAAFAYFLAVFSFGMDGDLAARASMYPGRMFTLPVSTAALAGWPMLWGTTALALVYLGIRWLGIFPAELDLPVIWPALLLAALLAWTQVFTWLPYGLTGLRVVVAVLWLAAIDTIVLVALNLNASESVMIAFLAPQLPLAYGAACLAVARARRGAVPDWRHWFARPERAAATGVAFASPARAQFWFEWRRHGRSLPVLVASVLPFELALLFLMRGTPALVFFTLLSVLFTPIVMATFAAAALSKSNPEARDSYGIAPFMATRPVTSAALTAAKLKMTLASTLAAWLLVLLAIPIALELTDTTQIVIGPVRRYSAIIGSDRAAVIALLAVFALMSSTWKQLVQSLYIGLSGREWVSRGSMLFTLTLLFFIGPLLEWIVENGHVVTALFDALIWILAGLVALKLVAAAWIATRIYRSRALTDRALVMGAAAWCVAVLALYGLLVWLVGSPLFPPHMLAVIAILAIPLARLSAAPLALNWNRHR